MNSITLDQDESFYRVQHNGKTVNCARVTTIIKSAQPTPVEIMRWVMNCGVKAIANNITHASHDPEELKLLQSMAWSAHGIESAKALEIGSEVHDTIERYWDRFDGDLGSKEALTAYNGFLKFVSDHKPTPLAQEFTLYNITHRVAGTIDFIGTLSSSKDSLWILDWKTSKSLYRNYYLQGSWYALMLRLFVRSYMASPSSYSNKIQTSMSKILQGDIKNIRVGLVQLKKDPNVNYRKPYKFEEVEPVKMKYYIEEFKLMNQLYNHRKKEDKL